MNAKRVAWFAVIALALGAGAYGIYTLGMNNGMSMASAPAAPERRVLYWHDPMTPGPRFDKPGKSPFMDMQLVPVYAGENDDASPSVRIDPAVQQNLGVRTAEVTRGSLATRVEAVGSIAYNERDTALVQARSNGYVERLFVRAPLDPVRAGQPLAELYVPDWVAAQEEYLSVKRMGANAPAGLLDATLQRMRLAGMSEPQVRAVESEGKTRARSTVTAPISGVVSELTAREGMTVANGAPLFKINGLATVWVNAELPETMAHEVRPGAPAEVTTAAFPGEVFKARVSAILPEINAATRTLKARLEISNPNAKLVPGMFATVGFTSSAAVQSLLVPSEAVIRTGKRDLVMVAKPEGRFVPVEVDVGAESGGKSEIRKGLEAGDKVVVSGQFLVDSEATLKGIEARPPAKP